MIAKTWRVATEKLDDMVFSRRIGREFCGAFNDRRTIFIHVPKAAGSSVSLSLFGHQVGHDSIVDYFRKDYAKASSFYKFAFVREPLDRLYSAFIFLQHGGMNRDDAKFANEHLSNIDFDAFVKKLADNEALLQWLHFRPQYSFLYDGANPKNILVDFVGRFENLEADLAIVTQRLGLQTEVPHHNRTAGASGERRAFDAETRRLVHRIYADDFETFGYTDG